MKLALEKLIMEGKYGASVPLTRKLFVTEDAEFLKGGASTGGDSPRPTFPLPAWVDPERVRKGQEFVRAHFFSVLFAHFISLIFLLCYSPVRLVLLRTQKSETTLKALRRYLSTLVHVKLWYEKELLLETGEGAEDILRIRNVHSRVVRSMEKRLLLGSDSSPSPVIISQLDMAVTQFCFSGLIYLHPKVFGVLPSSSSTSAPSSGSLEDFMHLWAVIGHQLGLDEKYNLCLEQNLSKNRTVLERLLVPELKTSSTAQESRVLWASLVSGMGRVIPFLSLSAILRFVRKELLEKSLPASISRDKCPHLFPASSWYDDLCLTLMSHCFQSWLSLGVVQQLLSSLLRLAIHVNAKMYLGSSSTRSSSLSSSPTTRSGGLRDGRSA